MKVFINPGRSPQGNPDPGAINPNSKLRECDAVLSIGTLLAHHLNAAGIETQILQDEGMVRLRERGPRQLEEPRRAAEPRDVRMGEEGRQGVGEPGRRAQREVVLVRLLQLRAGRRNRRRGGGPPGGAVPRPHRQAARRRRVVHRSHGFRRRRRTSLPLLGQQGMLVRRAERGHGVVQGRMARDPRLRRREVLRSEVRAHELGPRQGGADRLLRGGAVGDEAQRNLLPLIRRGRSSRAHGVLHRADDQRTLDLPRKDHGHAAQQLHDTRRQHRVQGQELHVLPQRCASGRRRLQALRMHRGVQVERGRDDSVHPADEGGRAAPGVHRGQGGQVLDRRLEGKAIRDPSPPRRQKAGREVSDSRHLPRLRREQVRARWVLPRVRGSLRAARRRVRQVRLQRTRRERGRDARHDGSERSRGREARRRVGRVASVVQRKGLGRRTFPGRSRRGDDGGLARRQGFARRAPRASVRAEGRRAQRLHVRIAL